MEEDTMRTHLWAWCAELKKSAPGGHYRQAVGGWIKAPDEESALELGQIAVHEDYPPGSGVEIHRLAVKMIPDEEVIQVADMLRSSE
jgi:hypothetical protein